MTQKQQQQENKPPRLCDKCDNPGMWHLRAKTQFLCEEHRRKLEWTQGEKSE